MFEVVSNNLSATFRADDSPSSDLRDELASLAPTNPFYTPAYLEAKQRLGYRVSVIGVFHDLQLVGGCPVFVKKGPLGAWAEIDSLPTLADGESFWSGLSTWCHTARVSRLQLGSYAASSAALPDLPCVMTRVARKEWNVDLTADHLEDRLSSNHARHVRTAHKRGLTLQCTTSAAAIAAHSRLMRESLQRRLARGESSDGFVDDRELFALAGAGVGEFYQVLAQGQVVSSVLVLRARQGAYYHSAGTSGEGMSLGASHFLVHEVCRVLQCAGCQVFYLGGAGNENPGLARFKAGFGAVPTELAAAECHFGTSLPRKLATAVRLLRRRPRDLISRIGTVSRFLVFAIEPSDAPRPLPIEGVTIEPLRDDALQSLRLDVPELAEHVERIRQFKFNDAYGVLSNGRLAHIAWLVPAHHDAMLPVRNVKLRDSEAEITHCYTLPEFRGRGLYVHAIRCLCHIASQQGIARVFMIVNEQNEASRRGVEKAGLVRQGTILRFSSPQLPEVAAITLRGHRWRPATSRWRTKTTASTYPAS